MIIVISKGYDVSFFDCAPLKGEPDIGECEELLAREQCREKVHEL